MTSEYSCWYLESVTKVVSMIFKERVKEYGLRWRFEGETHIRVLVHLYEDLCEGGPEWQPGVNHVVATKDPMICDI